MQHACQWLRDNGSRPQPQSRTDHPTPLVSSEASTGKGLKTLFWLITFQGVPGLKEAVFWNHLKGEGNGALRLETGRVYDRGERPLGVLALTSATPKCELSSVTSLSL